MLPFFYNFISMLRTLLLLLLVAPSLSHAQWSTSCDTLTNDRRILSSLDSIDYVSGDLPTSLEGGRSLLSYEGWSLQRFRNDYIGLRSDNRLHYRRMKFSSLPVLSFNYSFGGQNSQFMDAQYVHAFNDSLTLNIDFQRRSGLGFLRNTSFRNNRIRLMLDHKGERYSLQLRAAYLNDSLVHSGGVQDDSIVVSLGLEFAPVFKQSASSNRQDVDVYARNYFAIVARDAQLGLFTRHRYQLINRRFFESDNLSSIYSNIYYDSTQTVDEFNLASIENSAGIYFNKGRIDFNATIGHRYWELRSKGPLSDTSEVDINASLVWFGKKLKLSDDLYFNFAGAYNGIRNRATIQYAVRGFDGAAQLEFAALPPSPYQRSLFANNYRFDNKNVNLQTSILLRSHLSYQLNGNYSIRARLNHLATSGVYHINDSLWEQSTESIQLIQAGVEAKMHWGGLHFYPRFVYTIGNSNSIPEMQVYARLFYKAKLFEAKKLEVLFGVDGSFSSDYELRTYSAVMDAYRWDGALALASPMANAHAFMAMEIAAFRFYARFENVGYFWNSSAIQEISAYPIAGQRVRLGVTWDFVN